MGICTSKKASKTLNVIVASTVPPEKEDFANLKNTLPTAAEKESRFEKVKIHAQTKKDPEAIVAAAKHLNELGVTTKSIQKIKPGTSDIYLYQRLPQAVQSSFLKDLSKEDFQRYYPKSNKKTKADPQIQQLFRKYYGNQ